MINEGRVVVGAINLRFLGILEKSTSDRLDHDSPFTAKDERAEVM